MYTIHYTKAAIKAPIKIPADYRERIVGEIESVAASPALYRGDWKRMQGLWRLRVGGYRAICELRDGDLVLLVVKVGSRGDVYK